jgi:hypothetical protein
LVTEQTHSIDECRRFIGQLRRDVATDFPERAGDIFIVDQSRDPAEQIAEAADKFGIPDLYQRLEAQDTKKNGVFPALDGIAMHVRLDDPPRTVWVTYGWGYGHNLQNSAHIDADSFRGLMKVTLHELGHALQLGDHRQGFWAIRDDNGFSESYAELFAEDVMRRTGLLNPMDMDRLNAEYDERKFFDEKDQRLISPQGDHYDPSEEYAALVRRYPENPLPSDRLPEHFPLRDSFTRTLDIATQVHLPLVENHARFFLLQLSDEALRTLRHQGKSEEEVKQWVDERPWLFPDRVQAEGAQAYLAVLRQMDTEFDAQGVPAGKRQYPHYEPVMGPPANLEQAAAQAWLLQARTKDPLDVWLGQHLFNDLLQRDGFTPMEGLVPADGLSEAQESTLVQHTEETGWARQLLAATGTEEAFAGLRRIADTLPPGDPNFSVSEVPPGSPTVPIWQKFQNERGSDPQR